MRDCWWLTPVHPHSQNTPKYHLLISRISIFTFFSLHMLHLECELHLPKVMSEIHPDSIDITTGWYSILEDAQCTSTCVVVATCMEMWSCSQEMWWTLKWPRGALGARHDESFMPHDDVNPDTSPRWVGWFLQEIYENSILSIIGHNFSAFTKQHQLIVSVKKDPSDQLNYMNYQRRRRKFM